MHKISINELTRMQCSRAIKCTLPSNVNDEQRLLCCMRVCVCVCERIALLRIRNGPFASGVLMLRVVQILSDCINGAFTNTKLYYQTEA